MNPILSIIVPVYGVEKFIERCARSLFEQTILTKYPVEFIFDNDCTKDNSVQILEEVIQEYPQLREKISIVNLLKNGGLFMARHEGIMRAKGMYIAHIDSDDFIDRTMFEKMVEKALLWNLDMVWCGMVREKQDGNRPRVAIYDFRTPEEFLRQAIHDDRIWCVWGKIYRREIAMAAEETVPLERINFAEDLMRTVPMLLRCKNCAPVHEELYHYCENMGSISNAKTMRDFFPDVIKVGYFIASQLPNEYYQEVLLYKQMMLWNAITMHTPSTYKLFKQTWPEAKKSPLKNAKISYRFIFRLSVFWFPLGACFWRFFMPLYLFFKGKKQLIK